MLDKDANDTEIIFTDDQVREEKNINKPDQSLPNKLYLVPIGNRPFFPAQVQPIILPSDEWEETITKVKKSTKKSMGLIYIQNLKSKENKLNISDFPEIGCAVKIHNIITEDGQTQFIAVGMKRFRITKFLRKRPPYLVQVEYPEITEEQTDEIKAYALAMIQAIKELIPLNPLYTEELKNYLNRFNPKDPSPLADFAAAITTASGHDLQDVLATFDIQRRMEKVFALVKKEQEVAKLQGEINAEVNQKINKHQREFFLKEQLKIIHKELGISKDDRTADIEEFKERMGKLSIPSLSKKKIEDEIKKLSILEIGSPEYSISRNYLDWATSVPWGIYSKDNFDIDKARHVLDSEHEGLSDVKDRIIEFLAVGAYKNEISGSIMLLVGPPGVGKTSIGRSVAKSLERKFYRFSLGGMQDEAEIKGHRKTYIGAMPGKLVQALKDVSVSNPVIMLDEIDKVGTSYKGDPASALLEVLDPEQNIEFLDHYLDMRVDLSKVLFICTANQLDSIPGPLLDRMDMIRLAGYITEEKVKIAQNYLWPKQLKKAGLRKAQLKISEKLIKFLINGYAREAGVRHLNKLLEKIIRKAVVFFIKGKQKTLTINHTILEKYLGTPYFKDDKKIEGIGVVTGLAWTSMGGATLPVEAALIHRIRAGFKVTGKLGDVMKESSEIALSYVSSKTKDFDIKKDFFENAFIHLHVPEGATPKDGPSAGVTIATALISLARNKKIRTLAMTGELTLSGNVLAVGGIREKVISARRQDILELILPEENRRDYEELPDYIRKGMTVHFASMYTDVYKVVFQK